MGSEANSVGPDKQSAEDPAPQRVSRLRNVEALGELIMLLVVGAFFATMFIESFGWRTASWLMPRIGIGFGTPFLLIRTFVVARFFLTSQDRSHEGVRDAGERTGEIMDLGFYISEGATRRFLLAAATVIGFVLGVWIFGWHVGVPLYMFLYLFFSAKVKLWQAVLSALFMLGIIVGLYDQLIRTNWNEPLLLKLFGS